MTSTTLERNDAQNVLKPKEISHELVSDRTSGYVEHNQENVQFSRYGTGHNGADCFSRCSQRFFCGRGRQRPVTSTRTTRMRLTVLREQLSDRDLALLA